MPADCTRFFLERELQRAVGPERLWDPRCWGAPLECLKQPDPYFYYGIVVLWYYGT